MTMYSDTVAKLKYDWQAMLNSGKMPMFELQDASGDYHIFDIAFYQSYNNLWYFAAYDDSGRKLSGLAVDQYFDDLSHYLEVMYGRFFKECHK